MQFSSTPAWSFGIRGGGAGDKLNTPGPGEYKQKDDYKGGFTLGKSPRGKSNKLENEVGPGHYNYDYSSLAKQGPSLKGRTFVPDGYQILK